MHSSNLNIQNTNLQNELLKFDKKKYLIQLLDNVKQNVISNIYDEQNIDILIQKLQ